MSVAKDIVCGGRGLFTRACPVQPVNPPSLTLQIEVCG